MVNIPSSEITPEQVYLNRRKFMKGVATLALGSLVLAACGSKAIEKEATPDSAATASPEDTQASSGAQAGATTDELGDPVNTLEQITNYNNFYEFSIDKQAVAGLAKGMVTSSWEVAVGGLVHNPRTYDIEELRRFDQEERIYRLRCVEGWSMVIPWLGFPISRLLKEVEPMADAKYVRFETLYEPDQFPGQRDGLYAWPYVECLRIDEAMNDLAILATGLYGKTLLPQNGAPLRLVMPWKYGFKSIKSIVKIDLVSEMPKSLWMQAAPHEYGFYANVNPDVPHPRWSQSSERRIGELSRRPTLPFNGYAEQVASLYAGMDLRVNY